MAAPQEIPTQTELVWVSGNPNGTDFGFAPPGFLVIDAVTGNLWRKTTRQELNTGWVLMGGNSFGSGGFLLFDTLADLPALPPDQSLVWMAIFRDGSPSFVWDPRDQVWI